MRPILLTGGHGFIGSHVVRALRDRDRPVRCLVRATSRTHRIDGLGVETVTGDIMDPSSLAAAMAGCSACIHLASVSSYADLDRPHARPTIVDGTRNVLQAALDVGLERVVHVSSAVIFGSHDPERISDETGDFQLAGSGLTYIESKHEAEQIVDDFVDKGLDVVVAVPTETYGPNDDDFLTTGYLKEAINSWPAFATHGGTMFGHVADVAEGIVLCLEKGRIGERYILGVKNASIRDIIAMTLDVAGRSKPIWVLPTGLLKVVLGTLHRLGLPSPEHPNAINYGTLYYYVSSEKAQQELGWTPRSGRETLEDTVAWLRDAGHIR
ncbi:MAG: NAD-dependent epimerase/dehydratase family protein [Myxococcota bacterium]